MQYSELYAKHILSLCRQRAISVNQLASMSGIRQSTINNIIHGSSKNPKIMTLHKIAIAFSMTLSDFLNFDALNFYSFDDETEN